MINRQVVLTRVFRFLLVAGLFLIVGAIVWYLAFRGRTRLVEPAKVPSIPMEKVERQEGVEHFDFKGERVIQVKAERHYAGPEERYYLEGNVEVKEVDTKSGRQKIIRGDRISYDRDWREIFLEGHASIEQEDTKVESVFLRYEKEPEMIRTESGATFFSRKISGRARRLSYAVGDDWLRLEEDVQLELKDKARSEEAFVVRARAFEYSRPTRRGEAQGEVTFSWGKDHGRAESLMFEVTPDEESVDRIELRAKAGLFLVSRQMAEAEAKSLPLATGFERQLEAEKIGLTLFPGSTQIQSLEAEGSCLLKSVTQNGSMAIVRANSLCLFFDAAGQMARFLAEGQASYEERKEDGLEERRLAGQTILVEEQGEKISVRSGVLPSTRMESPDSEVFARVITLFPEREILEAMGEVKVVLKARPETEERVGFFGRQRPVFITAQWMRFHGQEERFIFKENIRLWQDRNMLLAEELTVFQETGEMAGQGKVQATFFVASTDGQKERRIDMGGNKIAFAARTNLLTFEEGAWVKTASVSLDGQSLMATLAEKKAEVQGIKAKGKVTVRDALREGQSEEASYDVEKESMVLTGNPVVRDKNRGIIRGDKLTFNLGDDRISVENKERERSTTVIKRGQ